MTGTNRRSLHFEPLGKTLDSFGYLAETGERRLATLASVQAGMAQFERHGDAPRWRRAVDALSNLSARHYAIDRPIVEIGSEAELTATEREAVTAVLTELCPWRKGPFRVFGVDVDAEWRSDLKWSRVERAVLSLGGHRVLDIGCGNGYYCLRALGAGAATVLGVEPSALFVLQFEALKRLLPALPALVLPLSFEALPPHPTGFDTVLSMGLLYHRRSPLEHLERLRGCLAEGGQLVLETLVVESRFGPVLEPRGRYANMSNVWSIPSIVELSGWLARVGLHQVHVADVTPTSPAEQRPTRWSTAHSLKEALDPDDPTKTIEGYPAPLRAVIVARR